MSALYLDDLAYIQARAFGGLAAQATPEIVSLLAGAGISRGRLIDIGCGAGESTRQFLQAGFDVWVMEPSAALLVYARAAAPAAHFAPPISAYDAVLPCADVVVAVGEPLTYHYKHQDADGRLRHFFCKVATALRPGGMLLFDIIVEGAASLTARGWLTGEDWAILFANEEDAARAWLTRRIDTFRLVGGHYRRGHEEHDVRLFQSDLVVQWLEQAGFKVHTAPAYGRYQLAVRRLAFVAQRI